MYSFTYENHSGRSRKMHVESGERFTVETTLPLDEILKGIERDRELIDHSAVNKTLARVPMTIYEQSLREQWDDKDWKRWLNDPQNEPFRIWKGRV